MPRKQLGIQPSRKFLPRTIRRSRDTRRILSCTQLRLQLFNSREASRKCRRKFLREPGLPSGDADGLLEISKGVLDYHLMLRAAEQQANRGLVLRVPHLVVDCGKIEIDLADERRLERHCFQLDHHETTQFEVVEKQIENDSSFPTDK